MPLPNVLCMCTLVLGCFIMILEFMGCGVSSNILGLAFTYIVFSSGYIIIWISISDEAFFGSISISKLLPDNLLIKWIKDELFEWKEFLVDPWREMLQENKEE